MLTFISVDLCGREAWSLVTSMVLDNITQHWEY